MPWLLIYRSCSNFSKISSLFSVIGQPKRASSLASKYLEQNQTNHSHAADFDTAPLREIPRIFQKPVMRCRLFRRGIVKYSEFSLYSGPFLNLNTFWYTTPISIKFCAKQSFKCHLSIMRLVLLMRLVVIELHLLLTVSRPGMY